MTNGENQYVGFLTLGYDDNNLIYEFQFDWKLINQEDYEETSTKAALVQQLSYNSIIGAEYDTGVTPYKFEYLDESLGTNNFVVGWMHGDITRPSFVKTARANTYSATYSPDELAKLEEQFSTDDIQTVVENVITSMATEVDQLIDFDLSENLEFQKNKNRKIDFNKISKFGSESTSPNIIGTTMTVNTQNTDTGEFGLYYDL